MAVALVEVPALVADREGQEQLPAGYQHPAELGENGGQVCRRNVDERVPGDPDEDLRDGSAYVCGVGSLPVPLLVALADLEDAREQARAHPEEPARDDALYRATKAYIMAARDTPTRGRADS